MGNFIGVWKLDEPIYCQKEISGKRFRTIIAGVPVVIAFPSLPDAYDGESKALSSGDLISPFPPFSSAGCPSPIPASCPSSFYGRHGG